MEEIINVFVSLINTVGFPIAACIFLFIQQSKLTKSFSELSETLKSMNDRIDALGKKIEGK